MLRWFEHSQVYHPYREMTATGAELGRPYEDVYFEAGDGVRLNGWFFPANTHSPRRHLAVVYCHGNGGNICHRLPPCESLLTTGVNVFLFDYRGYGRSAGRPSEEGTYLDAQAAYDWLRGKGFAGTNLIAFGESLGGGVAAELAVRVPLGGLVLMSTFTSIPAMAADLFPWLPFRGLGVIRYDTVSKLPRVRVPVLILHSPADGLVRFRHAEANYAAANEPKLLWRIAGDHNNPLEDGRAFTEGVERFLTMLEGRGR